MLTKEERDKLAQEIKKSIATDLDEQCKGVLAQVKEATDGMVAKFDQLNEGSGGGYHSRTLNAPRHGVANTEEDPGGLVFQDKDGKVYHAVSLKKNLFQGRDEDFSIGRILRAKILGDLKGLNDFEQKAAGEGIGAAGGWLLSEEVSARLIDLARNKSCVMEAGAVTIQMATPELRLVKLLSDPTAHWTAEHGEVAESDWSLGPINLKAMQISVLVRSSLELLEDAENAGEQIINSMSAAIALEIDRVAILGNGVGEPRGLDVCSDINEISKGVNGGTLTDYDDFSNGCEDIAENNGEANAVIMAPRSFFTLDRLKEGTTNAPLPAPESYKALKAFKTNQIGVADTVGTATNCSKIFIGAFQNVLYGIRKQLEIETTRSGGTLTFAKNQMLIRCRARLDVAILREPHFTRISGIKV